EAWAPNVERLANYTRPDELHQAFNFHFLGVGWYAAALRRVIAESMAAAAAVGAPPTWVLGNHDVQRQVTRFGDGAGGPGPGTCRGTADARAARFDVPVPRRGAGLGGGARPARGVAAGPRVAAVRAHPAGPRRVPRAAALVR